MRLQDLAAVATIFLVIAIVLSVSGDILSSLETKYDNNPTLNISNETQTITGAPAGIGGSFIVNNPGIEDGLVTSSLIIHNASNYTIANTNWNAFANGSVILGAGALLGNGTNELNVTYDYYIQEGSVRYNASRYGNQSEEELASWLPTIAIIIAAAIIIGLIFVYFKVR